MFFLCTRCSFGAPDVALVHQHQHQALSRLVPGVGRASTKTSQCYGRSPPFGTGCGEFGRRAQTHTANQAHTHTANQAHTHTANQAHKHAANQSQRHAANQPIKHTSTQPISHRGSSARRQPDTETTRQRQCGRNIDTVRHGDQNGVREATGHSH